jgi:CDP-diacylglycerol--serine O-phosphatidyltransferase
MAMSPDMNPDMNADRQREPAPPTPSSDLRTGLLSDPRKPKRGRGIYLLPSAMTVANLLCGFYAILATLKGGVMDLDFASRAIGFAIVFDAFDGFVARATGTNTEFGKQFDSLADMVSFGIAPSILAFTWGVQALLADDIPEARHISQIAWVVSLAFVICCAWRLARFNVQGMAPVGGLRYFVGMPTPAAAGMVAATVHAWKYPIDDWRWSLAWFALVLGLAALMVSGVRFFSFKELPLAKRLHSLWIVVVALLVWSIVVYSEIVLLLIAAGYLVTGLTLLVVRAVRHRLVSRPA